MAYETIKVENEFCESIDCEKNKNDLYVYNSTNEKSKINLPWILLEYKQWMIDKGLIKQIK